MAFFEIDPKQWAELTTSIAQLSDNLAKWQAQQTVAIQTGFASLIAALSGADVAEIQQRIDALTQDLKTSSDTVETAINQDKGE